MPDRESDQMAGVSNIRRFVSFVGICVLLLSQLLGFSKPLSDTIWIPPYTWLGILGIAILLAAQAIPSTSFWMKLSALPVFHDRAFWVTAALLLSVVATVVTGNFMNFQRLNYIPVISVWLMAAACYLYALLSPDPKVDSAAVSSWFNTHRIEILAVFLITLAAALLRFHRLGEIPRVLDGDEGLVGFAAKSTTSGELANPFALWENFGALYLQSINAAMQLFGETPLGLRFMATVGGILAIPAVYLLARQVGGIRIALISAVMIAISHTHIHFSRIASVAYIQDTWLVPLELYFLLSGLAKRESWRSGLAGILLAFHYSVYLTSQIMTVLIVLFMLIALIAYRSWFRERLAQVGAFWGGFLIMIMPSALYIYRYPNHFVDRMVQDGMFNTSWLAIHMQTTGQGMPEILFKRVVHAFFSLTYYPAFDFYGSTAPMISVITSVLLLAGLAVILWRLRNPSYLLLNGYFWGAAVAVGVFANPPSADSYRMLWALPAALIIASIGFDQLLSALAVGWNESRLAYAFTVTALLAGLLIFNTWMYYGEFARQCRYIGDQPGRFASYLGSELRDIDNGNQVYLLSDDVFLFGSHSSTLFLSRSRVAINWNEPLETLTPSSGETIIASPQRISELQAWALAHPGGQQHVVYDCDAIILFSYRVP